MSGSEVARLLQQIQAEEEAARRAIYDPAIVSAHQFITKRSENISQHVHTLIEVVGDFNEAMNLFITVQTQLDEKIKVSHYD